MQCIDCRAMDTFHFRRVQSVKFALVAGLLAKDLLCPFQNTPEGGFDLWVSHDFAPNVADKAAKPGAHLADPAQAPLVAASLQQPHASLAPTSRQPHANLTPGAGRQPDEGLTHLDVMAFCDPVQPLDGAQDQVPPLVL
jgi:hypothetical protein